MKGSILWYPYRSLIVALIDPFLREPFDLRFLSRPPLSTEASWPAASDELSPTGRLKAFVEDCKGLGFVAFRV